MPGLPPDEDETPEEPHRDPLDADPLVLASCILDRAWKRCELQGGGEKVLNSPCKWCVHAEIVGTMRNLKTTLIGAILAATAIGVVGGWFLAVSTRCP